MVGNPRVLGLLEEMLNSGMTPEEACRDCPELLSEVRNRWQEFQLIDAEVRSLLPGLGTSPDAGAIAPPEADPSPPAAFGRYQVQRVLGPAASAPSTSATIPSSTGPWPSKCCAEELVDAAGSHEG
jgi:hypothetical protein